MMLTTLTGIPLPRISCSNVGCYYSLFICRSPFSEKTLTEYYYYPDSAVPVSPIPEEELSSTELGKWKRESKVDTGYFLAPKSYLLVTQNVDILLLKHKGPAKDLVSGEWYQSKYNEPNQSEVIRHRRNFFVDRKKAN